MATSNFSCTGINLTTSYTGDGVCTITLVENSIGGVPISGTFSITITTNAGEITEEGELCNDRRIVGIFRFFSEALEKSSKWF